MRKSESTYGPDKVKPTKLNGIKKPDKIRLRVFKKMGPSTCSIQA